MTKLEQLFAALGIALLMALVAGIIGFHLGGLSGAKKVSDLRTAQATAITLATKAGASAQIQADNVRLSDLQQALKNENADDAAKAADLAQLSGANRTLKARLNNEMAKSKDLAACGNLPVPHELLSDPGMCWYTGGRFTPACTDHTDAIRAPSVRRPDAVPGAYGHTIPHDHALRTRSGGHAGARVR